MRRARRATASSTIDPATVPTPTRLALMTCLVHAIFPLHDHAKDFPPCRLLESLEETIASCASIGWGRDGAISTAVFPDGCRGRHPSPSRRASRGVAIGSKPGGHPARVGDRG